MQKDIRIRKARVGEAEMLTELAMRSKAHWGYDAQFMADARSDLTVRPEKFLPEFHVYILEVDGFPAAFCGLARVDKQSVEMDSLFVEPERIGTGIGKLLWKFAVNAASKAGFSEMVLTADPYAEPFYLKMGAVRAGEKESSARPGRMLPLMKFTIPPAPNSV
jgi:N-acetylglutamate synthase-like GNAT family acetyltransferase